MTTDLPSPGLAALRGLRTAPALDGEARALLRQELTPRLQACEWFCEYQLKAESGDRSVPKQPVYGMKAIQLHIKDLAKKFEDAF